LAAVLTLCIALGSVIAAYPALYRGRIYPGISVRDIALGGLTVDEATALLIESLSAPSRPVIELQASTRTWRLDWAGVGRDYACSKTAEAAYQVARDGPWHDRALSAWRVRLYGLTLEPLVDSADPDRVRAELETLAPDIHAPPTDAALRISPSGVVCLQGTAGRALDVEATVERVTEALAIGASEVEIVTLALPPDLQVPEPGCSQAQSLLAQPFTLITDDPLTNYRARHEAPPERLAAWLRVVPSDGEVLLEVERQAVCTWLLEIAPQLEPDRILDIEETMKRTLAALEDGEQQARAAIWHPEYSYVVQPGDTLFDIAYRHGFPQWRLEEANPDVEPDQLLIGMELTIPSVDVLFPEPLVPGKRIEIDLPEQNLRAYEDDTLVYDFTCSSGISTTPTIAGQFQVLFKEPEAYAQRWSLEMPYFMAVYYEGPQFANGIHELPITAGGHRLWDGYLGWPASYGCIILDIGDAEKLYDWAPVGTLVRIEGVAPGTPTVEQRLGQAEQ
jgi:hypothetical protein